jgi:hypothetical protein
MELVAADMNMPEMYWLLNFIQAQGYKAKCIGLCQDKISSQLLIKKGKTLSGKKTKHIKSKFFFIKDRVDSGEIKVIDYPTEERWADVLMKPLQGMAFRTMRAELMTCQVNYDKNDECESDLANQKQQAARRGTKTAINRTASMSPQECVGHKRFKSPTTDRPYGVGRARLKWQVGLGHTRRGSG